MTGVTAPVSTSPLSAAKSSVFCDLAVEAACRRGNHVGATTYGSIAPILKHGLDKAFAQEAAPDTPPLRHDNIRGPGTYH